MAGFSLHAVVAEGAPEGFYTGQIQKIGQIRQNALDLHYAQHPERYVNGPTVGQLPPERVCINPNDGQSAEQVLANPESFKILPTPVILQLPEVVT